MNHRTPDINGTPLPDTPIFIGGLERSGKTYMRLMLAAHPDWCFSKRANLWTRVYGRFGDLNDDANLDRCLGAMWANRHVREMGLEREALRRVFHGDPRTYARLFALLHRGYAARLGKHRWGDQTEGIELVADRILDAFPDARLIHMLRDPRDRYEALIARDAGRPGRLAEATERWRQSAAAAARNERRYPVRYRVVRYETLVLEQENTLNELAAWLGIEPTAGMLALGHANRFAHSPNGNSPLSAAYIGRFRANLPAHEIAYIQRRLGPLMQAQGYAPEPVRLSTGDRLRSGLLTPMTAAFTRLALDIGRAARGPLGIHK